MALIANLVVAATTVLAAPSLPATRMLDGAAVTRLVFEVDLPTFTAARAARSPAGLDWSSDGCSTPFAVGLGDTGRSFDFGAACRRHDFAYRNHRALGVTGGGAWWNERVRRRIDDRFLADMLAGCAPRPWTQRASCRGWARTYHRMVRIAGDW